MYKEFIKNIKNVKKESLLAPLFVFFEIVFNILIPFIMAYLIDEGIDKNNFDAVIQYGGLLLIMSLLALFCGFSSGKYAAKAATGLAASLRSNMFKNIQTFSFNNIDYFSSSSLVTRMTTDVNFVQNAYQMIVRIAFRAPLMMVAAFAMVLKINLQLGLIFIGVLPVLGIGLYFIIKHAHPYFVKSFKEYDLLNQTVQENLHGIRTVKSFVREDYEDKKFKFHSNRIYQLFLKAETIAAYNNPLMNLCLNASRLLICWLAARLIVAGTMSTGQLASIMTYTMQILMSLMMVSMILVMVVISKASLDRINEVLMTKADLISPENPITTVKDGSVVFKNVSFSYNEKQERKVLHDINLEIKTGEMVGIIGGTGSSKSSIVQLIPRLYDVNEGEVIVGGENVKNYELKALRDQVAMVLQKNTLFSGTIKENLRWGNPQATDEQLIEACKIAQAHDFIQSFPDGYDTYIEQGGTNVSGGQKQRLCIARALLKNPKIIIFDDSTSAVDTKTDAMIQRGLKESLPNTTKIIIAQRISSISEADKIIVLDEGEISAIGDHQSLLNESPIYKEVYQSQQKGVEA